MLTILTTGVLSYALPGRESGHSITRLFLPGETTHGHYQIELQCSACHTPWGGVNEQSCVDCHGPDLKASRDTHPQSKFRDPSNIPLLEKLDASKCITCHREHQADRTHAMGVSLPEDYCFNCHLDIADDRPSHKGMAFNTCTNAGCHNYHDNLALYEKFLDDHYGENDYLDDPRVAVRTSKGFNDVSLVKADHDSPKKYVDNDILDDWGQSAHARAGVNCQGCHQQKNMKGNLTKTSWSTHLDHQSCERCHQEEVTGFLSGKHGMRLAQGLSPMSPRMARHPMHNDSLHRELNCMSCHSDHSFNTVTAAVDACVKCHQDDHSKNYLNSSHYQLWLSEQAGDIPAGSGVSCATCHLPRYESNNNHTLVQHNQNWNLEPNEKMVRSVCLNCHGLEFTLTSLADDNSIRSGFSTSSTNRVKSVQMAHDWFESKRKRKNQ